MKDIPLRLDLILSDIDRDNSDHNSLLGLTSFTLHFTVRKFERYIFLISLKPSFSEENLTVDKALKSVLY